MATRTIRAVENGFEMDGDSYEIATGAVVRDTVRIEKRMLDDGEIVIGMRIDNAESGRFAWCQMSRATAARIGNMLREYALEG